MPNYNIANQSEAPRVGHLSFQQTLDLNYLKKNTLAYHKIWYYMERKSSIMFSLQLCRKLTPDRIYFIQFFKVNLLFELSFVNLFHNCNYTLEQ